MTTPNTELLPTDEEIRLHLGELSARELRISKAAIQWANTRTPAPSASLPRNEDVQWRDIKTLPMNDCHGYKISERVLLSRKFENSENHTIVGRVWLENDTYSLPDNKYEYYEYVTHWAPLPSLYTATPTHPRIGGKDE